MRRVTSLLFTALLFTSATPAMARSVWEIQKGNARIAAARTAAEAARKQATFTKVGATKPDSHRLQVTAARAKVSAGKTAIDECKAEGLTLDNMKVCVAQKTAAAAKQAVAEQKTTGTFFKPQDYTPKYPAFQQ